MIRILKTGLAAATIFAAALTATATLAQDTIRVAVTGRTVGLPLFESLELLGPEVTVARVRAARALLG